MTQWRLNPFVHRQVMEKPDFEIFHYNNAATCSCPPHQHEFYEIFCLLDDHLDYIVEGVRYTMAPGDFMLVPPGPVHRADVAGPVRDIDRFVLWLNAGYARELMDTLPSGRDLLLGGLSGHNLLQPGREAGELMRRLLYELHREAGADQPDADLMCRSIIVQLLICCGRCITCGPDRAAPRMEARYHEIMRIYEYIAGHLQEDLSVTGLSERFFMDKNTLTRQFKRQIGMTPGECIRRHRLEAVRWRIMGGTPIQQACAECGFADYSAFYRNFRQAFGVSPSDYVARRREEVTVP